MSGNKYTLELCEYSNKFLSRMYELNEIAKNSNCSIK